jgi:hypothetical protein
VLRSLQRLAGNSATVDLLGRLSRPTVQRQAAPAATTPGFAWRGVHITTSADAIRPQLERIVEKGGLGDLREWASSYFALDDNQKLAIATGLQLGDIKPFDAAVRVANDGIESDAKTFSDSLKPSADATTVAILDESKKKIESELEAYGIKEEDIPPDGGGGGAEGAPGAYEKRITIGNLGEAENAQARARKLGQLRRAADKANEAFLELVRVPGMTEVEKVIKDQIEGLQTKYQAAEQEWKLSEDVYAKEAMAATADFPVIAMYAAGPDAASRLEGFANQPPEKLGETIWRESRTRLENIEKIRGGLGGPYNPLFNARIVGLVLDKPDVKPWQKRVGKDRVDAVKAKAEEKKEFWTTIAIGLGIIAALPTGGSAAAATVGAAATIAGAALSVYNLYDHWAEVELASASSNTDFAKAESLAKDDKSYLWLALDLIGAGLDVVGAAGPFKKLIGIIAEARTSKDVVKMAKAVDAVAPPAAAARIKATVADELGAQAVTDLAIIETRAGGVVKEARAAAEAEAAVTKVLGDASPEVKKAASLSDPESIRKLAETAGDTQSAWAKQYPTPEARAESLLALVNARLQAAGVPPMKGVSLAEGKGGSFAPRSWRMKLSKELLTKAKEQKDFAVLLNFAYHEARHAEQFFLIARRQAGMPGRSIRTMMVRPGAGGLDLHPEVAKLAIAAKVTEDSAEATKAFAWYDSIYGEGAKHRKQVLTRMDHFAKEMAKNKAIARDARKRLNRGDAAARLEVTRSYDDFYAAKDGYLKEHARYKLLPEEADAWEIGEQAERVYLDELQPITRREGRGRL